MLSATAAYECVCLLLGLFVVEEVCSTLVTNWLQSYKAMESTSVMSETYIWLKVVTLGPTVADDSVPVSFIARPVTYSVTVCGKDLQIQYYL